MKFWQTYRKQCVIAGALAAVLALTAAVILLVCRHDRLRGGWQLDEVTAYEFDGRGEGKMVLPSSEYPFSYELSGDKLSVDFVSEDAADKEYTWSVDGDTLTLRAGEQSYEMTRQK